MPVPKKKSTKSRKRQRRAHQKLSIPTLIICPNCGEATLPHRVCMKCGYYKGEQRIAVEEK